MASEEVPAGEHPLEAALAQAGHFGLYQGYVLFMLCLPNLLAAMYTLNYVFVADSVPFRCVIPECEGESDIQFDAVDRELMLPTDSQCHRFAPLGGVDANASALYCLREHYHQTDTAQCHDFVYQTMDTIFAEFGLACREWLRTLVGTVRNSALPLALLLTGYVSDRWGRRTAFCIFSGFAGVLGVVKGFSINYKMYLSFEFLEAALGYGFNSAGYVMAVELARPSLRPAFACATGVSYGLGGMLFALVAWRVPHWRRLLWAIHTPALLLPFYRLLLDESPRWLHARGRVQEASAVIKKAARWNKIVVNDDIMRSLENRMHSVEGKSEANPWLRLLKSRALMARFALCCWCWAATAFVYYGLTVNSVSLSGDKYANFALNMAMEVVASLLLVMSLERFGRKRSLFAAFVLCGVACVVPYLLSDRSSAGPAVTLFFTGKLAISFAFNSMYIFTAELFPTEVRSSALAACSLVGRVGSVLAPQTPLLTLRVQALLYGVCSAAAALAVLLVPETKRLRLPQAVHDAERIRQQ